MERRGPPDRPDLIIAARGVGLRYRARDALSGLDLTVEPGDVVGIVGPNGAGKTSLLRLLSTERRPTAGTLAVLGQDARRPTAALRRRIGVGGDEPVHLDALSGRDNALLLARAAGLPAAAAAARTAVLLQRVGLEPDAARPVAEYSLGMRRKLLLVETLAHDPALIILDEPTNGLDLAGRDVLRALLRERAAAGAAVVVASNDVAEVERWCTRVVFLRAGRCVLEGAPADLVARLGGATRFEFRLRADRAPEVHQPGVDIALATADRLVAHSSNGSAALPALCEAVLRAGAAIETVALRRPGLADVFLRATGEDLEGGSAA